MKQIIIRRSGLDDLPAMLVYKQFAIAGEEGQVHLYQVLKRGDGLYDDLASDFLAEDIKYESLASLTDAVIDKLLHTTLWDMFVDDRDLFIGYEKFQLLDKNKTY
ncbi:hypothetical protein P8917_16065 [Bacillus atrophaeus]|uniref:hypothetical protein n=1 Tax=Bacillus atrophaeus TaxID=1452 RepID=UPI001BEB2B33|nr:hypothetical protein [Bacillus atrophaeus]MBT2627198.1 hypothetical protein [Bacillus sp. ISL-32]MCY8467256.1 hypothetical protein [Bacillus atrophaeus]MCY8476391.1 hypothetical protein [Bacillus atrophaeus]MCY8496197.1 hypothetical protein [Bacillus atrophaeus]MCY8814861.1 hypothetical protein [Bacillus atrophaeus]